MKHVHHILFSASMSLLARKTTANVAKQPTQVVQQSDLFFTIAPQVHPSVTPTADKLKVQHNVISKMTNACELFAANPGVKTTAACGAECYHTSQLFGNSISCEELSHNMSEYGLCLALSASSPSQKSTVLGMVDASHLTNANFKAGGFTVQTGTRGSMHVNVEQVGKLHYVRSIDYKIK